MWFKNKRKDYFRKKLDGVQKMIWDLEFKRDKTLTIREEVRREYDGTLARLNIIETRLKSFPELDPALEGKDKQEKWNDEQRGHDDQLKLLIRDKERYLSQMQKMDIDVQGSRPTNEYPDGLEGINDQLDSLRELSTMIKNYLKQI